MSKKTWPLMIPRITFALFFPFFFAGCATAWEEPAVLAPEARPARPDRTPEQREKLRSDSRGAAMLGWYDLRQFRERNDPYYLNSAIRTFNYCWSFDSENFQSYWGWGIIRGEQATLPEFADRREQYLSQSVELLRMARMYAPADQQFRLAMDLANAKTGLGWFYRSAGKAAEAETPLAESRELLQAVRQTHPAEGRAYYLLAANAFYRGEIAEARQWAEQARGHGAALSPDFQRDLDNAGKGDGK